MHTFSRPSLVLQPLYSNNEIISLELDPFLDTLYTKQTEIGVNCTIPGQFCCKKGLANPTQHTYIKNYLTSIKHSIDHYNS